MIQPKNSIHSILSVMTGLIFFSMVLALLWISKADAEVVNVEGVNYSASASFLDNLKALKGKKVTIVLNSGMVETGIIKDISNHLLHLEKLDGKDFFDALLRIEDISAIETRFREIR